MGDRGGSDGQYIRAKGRLQGRFGGGRNKRAVVQSEKGSLRFDSLETRGEFFRVGWSPGGSLLTLLWMAGIL